LYAFPVVTAFAIKFPDQAAGEAIPQLLQAAISYFTYPYAKSAPDAVRHLGCFCSEIACDEAVIAPIWSKCEEILRSGVDGDRIPTEFYRATLVTFAKLFLRYGQGLDIAPVIQVFIHALKWSGPCDDLIVVFELFAVIIGRFFERACELCGADEVRQRISEHMGMPGVSAEIQDPLRNVVDRDPSTRDLYYPVH
jgi:hypothetical protein